MVLGFGFCNFVFDCLVCFGCSWLYVVVFVYGFWFGWVVVCLIWVFDCVMGNVVWFMCWLVVLRLFCCAGLVLFVDFVG